MHVYWVTLTVPQHSPLSWGCGVTAIDPEDVLVILREKVFPNWGTGTVETIEEVPSMETLFESKPDFVPMLTGNFLQRGVWFPRLGYEW